MCFSLSLSWMGPENEEGDGGGEGGGGRVGRVRLFYFVRSSFMNDLFRNFLSFKKWISFFLKIIVPFPSISVVFSLNDRFVKSFVQ